MQAKAQEAEKEGRRERGKGSNLLLEGKEKI